MTTVNIELRELVTMITTDVASKIVADIRENDIKPLARRMSVLEKDESKEKQANSHFKGMFDGAWKLAIIVLTIVEILHYVKL